MVNLLCQSIQSSEMPRTMISSSLCDDLQLSVAHSSEVPTIDAWQRLKTSFSRAQPSRPTLSWWGLAPFLHPLWQSLTSPPVALAHTGGLRGTPLEGIPWTLRWQSMLIWHGWSGLSRFCAVGVSVRDLLPAAIEVSVRDLHLARSLFSHSWHPDRF